MIRFLFRWIVRLLFLAGFAVFGYLVYFYFEIAHEVEPLVHYNPPKTTQIFDRNGKLLANVFEKEHRLYVPYKEIPGRVIEALVAIEDTLFYEHHGVNPEAIFRAIIKDIKARKMVEGASTLTQQLIKSTLLTRKKKIERKIKEALLAIRLEQLLSKEEILERYLNAVFFGHGYYGIRTAAYGYFRKDLDELTLKEIAVLVGLPKAPSAYDPTRHYANAMARANRVLNRMKALGWIDEETYLREIKEAPKVYDDTLTKNRAPYIVDAVMNMLQKEYPDIRRGGYKIETAIDLEYQQMAKSALSYGYDAYLKRHQNDDTNTSVFNGAMVVLDGRSGDILAMVGGVDYKKSAFNRAVSSRRQVGSAFKPFIYQTALELGYNPESKVADIARTYRFESGDTKKLWQPKNYEKDYKGMITLREALIHSRNLATINLVSEIGIMTLHKKLNPLGVKNLPYNLSIALGNIALSPLQVARLYTVFADMGRLHEPRLVTNIYDNDGRLIKHYNAKVKKIYSESQAYLMVDILRDIVKRGTGRNARVKGMDVAGKTGTTNKSVDTWFCSFTPDVEAVVWFGNDNNTPLARRETGGRTAAPVVRYFYQKLIQIHPEFKRKFKEPEGVYHVMQNGKDLIYTDKSPLPKEDQIIENEEIIF
ncbi:PBP1A family penicillin-binding protein [Hydrogenimonas thermophila]|uniref:transglycosylase domain-containing protein n=1 Tax=Hydrogenimonas thermophila TaxID=223786 RepID=UPI0029374832|nr:PBP1A family penicillin-binding protein [Hydrogenimonas thermophila]WOE69569.1 PBP1A family penicillin-binding protein [Hydrogenimonas thermophila]WOE72083.1 PBP1A family penicillin-binding protein [Hydrogenimonas thermophila]